MQAKNDQFPMTEIARSFTYKLNVGNYESRDFFCSQKSECTMEEAEAVADALHDFCKRQVMKAVAAYRAEAAAK
jgi:hypothetical protein